MDDLPSTAAHLGRRWQAIARRHVTIAFGCACGAPSGHISMADLEGDILAYLRDRYPRGDDPGVDAVLRPQDAVDRSSLPDLFRRMSEPSGPTSPAAARLAADLQRCVASAERAAVGRRGMLRADAG